MTMTESESREYLESVWEQVDWLTDIYVYINNRPLDSMESAVSYTQKLLAEIEELKGDIFVYVSLMTERAISSTTYNALLHAVKRAETLLAQKRVGMKEGK